MSRLSRRRFFLIATLPLAVSEPVRAQQPLTTLTLGQISKTAADWPLFAANGQGYFQANGLTVDSILTNSGAAGAMQITAGALDIAAISAPQALRSWSAAHRPIISIHTMSRCIVVGKKGVTSLAQLKGKTIIVGGPNDLTPRVHGSRPESARLKPADYTYTYAARDDEQYAALNSGAVDAVILFPAARLSGPEVSLAG